MRTQGLGFVRAKEPYPVVGANLWYAAWLGAPDVPGGQARLGRELDRLKTVGINNLRIMASGHEGPLKGSVSPAFTSRDGARNNALYVGLDFAMAEIAKRGMTAVLVLGNFWEWSGGFSTLLGRATGDYIDMNDPAHPWPAFPDRSSQLYLSADALKLYNDHVVSIVGRKNSVTGRAYAADPAIFSWQLANEPRPGGSEAAIAAHREAYLAWIAVTAATIRQMAPEHLVSLGQEGTQATNGDQGLVSAAHEHVDYVTAHIWPQNWGWVDPSDLAGTWPIAEKLTTDYISLHEALARTAGKPLLIEEFGFPRGAERYEPGTDDRYRQAFYQAIYKAVEQSRTDGGPLQGSNFWAWNGEGRAAHDDYRYRNGDGAAALMGDPPHEPQGWYGVFDEDAAMLDLIGVHARATGAA